MKQHRALQKDGFDTFDLNPEDYGYAGNETVQEVVPVEPCSSCICDECGINLVAFDLLQFRNDIEAISNEFIANFNETVLNPSVCAPENSPSCLRGVTDFQIALNEYSNVVATSLSDLDALICLQEKIGPVVPECPTVYLEDSSVSSYGRRTRRLEKIPVVGIEGNVGSMDNRGKSL